MSRKHKQTFERSTFRAASIEFSARDTVMAVVEGAPLEQTVVTLVSTPRCRTLVRLESVEQDGLLATVVGKIVRRGIR